jgi:phospholipid transport system substrate-binding protein
MPVLRITGVCLVLLLSWLVLSSPARAGSPTEQVRTTVNKVLTIVRIPNLKAEAQRDQLVEVISARFDLPEMAKRSLGLHWGRRTPEEQREFAQILAALFAKSYADNIESETDLSVLYLRERKDQNYAEVETKIIIANRSPFAINYKLHSVNNEWRIYDLVIDGISVINNYRSQFNRFIARSSFEGLVRIMKERQS